MSHLRIPIAGDRLKNARVEISTLSDDAILYLLGVAMVAFNEHIDGEAVPETKEKLRHIVECLHGPSAVVPSHVPPEALEFTLVLATTFMDLVPNRGQPSWTN